MTTGDTQELDDIEKILCGHISPVLIDPDSQDGLLRNPDFDQLHRKLTAYTNKQMEAELEALREEVKHEDLRTISQIITARIDKLKESGHD